MDAVEWYYKQYLNARQMDWSQSDVERYAEAECARLREALNDLQIENEALIAAVLANFLSDKAALAPEPEKEKP